MQDNIVENTIGWWSEWRKNRYWGYITSSGNGATLPADCCKNVRI